MVFAPRHATRPRWGDGIADRSIEGEGGREASSESTRRRCAGSTDEKGNNRRSERPIGVKGRRRGIEGDGDEDTGATEDRPRVTIESSTWCLDVPLELECEITRSGAVAEARNIEGSAAARHGADSSQGCLCVLGSLKLSNARGAGKSVSSKRAEKRNDVARLEIQVARY